MLVSGSVESARVCTLTSWSHISVSFPAWIFVRNDMLFLCLGVAILRIWQILNAWYGCDDSAPQRSIPTLPSP